MKKIHVLFFLFLSLSIYSQEKNKITKEFTVSEIAKIDYSKIYDKKTGEIISKKEFHKLIKQNKNYTLEKVIGFDGNIKKYLFTGNLKNNILKRGVNQRPKKGELFPNFKLKTIHNKTIELTNLKGKIIILRFELFADNFRFKKQEIIELDNQINKLGKENFNSIIIFTSSKDEILKGFNISNSTFDLVSNGMNFNERYKITNYPSTIVIDKFGKLIGYFKKSNEINLQEILKK
jgi:peroxiredoxin